MSDRSVNENYEISASQSKPNPLPDGNQKTGSSIGIELEREGERGSEEITTLPDHSGENIASFGVYQESSSSHSQRKSLERRTRSNEERLPLFDRSPSFTSPSDSSKVTKFYTPRNSLEGKSDPNLQSQFTPSVLKAADLRIAKADDEYHPDHMTYAHNNEKIPLLPISISKNEADKGRDSKKEKGSSDSDKRGSKNTTVQVPNRNSFFNDSNPNDDFCSLDYICCCGCCCNTKAYDMASDFTNVKFRDDFVSAVFQYKFAQMMVVLLMSVILLVTVVVSKTKERDSSDSISNNRPHFLAVSVILAKIYVVLVLSMKFCHYGREKLSGRLMLFILTLILFLFCVFLMSALGVTGSIALLSIVCAIGTSYYLLALLFKHELHFKWCGKQTVGAQLDISARRVYLNTIPITLACSVVSILIVYGFLNFVNALAASEESFSVLPSLFSESMLLVSLVSVGIPCIIILGEIYLACRLLSGSQVALENNEQLFASFFV